MLVSWGHKRVCQFNIQGFLLPTPGVDYRSLPQIGTFSISSAMVIAQTISLKWLVLSNVAYLQLGPLDREKAAVRQKPQRKWIISSRIVPAKSSFDDQERWDHRPAWGLDIKLRPGNPLNRDPCVTQEIRADYKRLEKKQRAKTDAHSNRYVSVSAHGSRKRKVSTFYGDSLEGWLSRVKILTDQYYGGRTPDEDDLANDFSQVDSNWRFGSASETRKVDDMMKTINMSSENHCSINYSLSLDVIIIHSDMSPKECTKTKLRFTGEDSAMILVITFGAGARSHFCVKNIVGSLRDGSSTLGSIQRRLRYQSSSEAAMTVMFDDSLGSMSFICMPNEMNTCIAWADTVNSAAIYPRVCLARLSIKSTWTGRPSNRQ